MEPTAAPDSPAAREGEAPHVAVISTVHDTYDTRIFYKQIPALRSVYPLTYFSPMQHEPEEHWIVPLRKARSKLGRLRTHGSLLVALARRKADIYVMHDPELLPLAIVLAIFGKRVVWDMHEDTFNDIKTKGYLPSAARSLISRAYLLLQQAAYRSIGGFILAEDGYLGYFPGGERTCVVHNYPMLDKLEQHAGATKRPDTLVYCGSISENRGIFELLDAVDRLRSRVPAIRLRLIGPFTHDELERRVRKIVEERRMTDNVEILGPIRNIETYPLVAECMIGLALLRSEPNFTKSLPTKMFEYMALGLPVVVSDFPLWRQIVVNNRVGAAVDPSRVDAVADAIHALLADPQRYAETSARAREAVKQYSWESESRVLTDFVARIAEKKRATSNVRLAR